MVAASDAPRAGITAWTVLLLAVATAGVEGLIWTSGAVWLHAAELILVIGGVGVAGWWTAHSAPLRPRPSGLEQLLLAGLFVLPVIFTAARHAGLGTGGWLLEMLLLAGLRNVSWGLLATRWEERLRVAAAVSLPMALAAALLSEHRLTPVLASLYVVTGCGWLMQWHWRHLPIGSDQRRLPGLALLAVMVLVAGSLGLALSRHTPITRSLWGWLPSSGGERWSDPASRAGVGDGTDEARGTQTAKSVGFSESDMYIDADEPSLYDVVGELYGTPRKMKAVERALALPVDKMRRRDVIPAENLRPGQEFQLLREPHATATPASRGADAILYVQGPAPAHLALVAFDWFDGVAWKEEPLSPLAIGVKNDGDDPWMEFIYPLTDPPDFFMLPVRHTIKIAKLKGSHLPTPAHLRGFRVGKLNVPSFFAWAQPGIVRLADRDVPKGTIFETEVFSVDPSALARHGDRMPHGVVNRNYLALPGQASCQRLLDETATAWTEGLPAGWPQINAILTRLRCDYELDPQWQDGPQTQDAVGHFLLHSKRGRDFHFASAAVLLLRSLGYPTRLVSGFYVNPQRWNDETGHFHLMREDLHFWPELLVQGRHWVVVEPTPGYELMAPRWTWTAWFTRLAEAVWLWCAARPFPVAAAAAVLAGLYLMRLDLLDALMTLWWRWLARRDARGRVKATLQLLEWRGLWSGLSRPLGAPVQRWYPPLATELHADPQVADNFGRWANWTLYAPHTESPVASAAQARAVCAQVVRACSLRHLRRAARQQRLKARQLQAGSEPDRG